MDENGALARFRENLTAAVRDSIANMASRTRLCGAALCTDDDLRTVYVVACSTDDCTSADDPDFRFLPVEWELKPEDDDRLLELSTEMSKLEGFADLFARRDVLFGVLISALGSLRVESIVSGEVLLLVTSTDPGKQLTQLAKSAIERLNTRESHQAFLDAEPW